MSEPLPPHAVVCLECGATVTRRAEGGVTRCWLCGHNVGPAADQPARITSPQFGIASLMLTITLVAVCLGVGVMHPGLGILLSVLVTQPLSGR